MAENSIRVLGLGEAINNLKQLEEKLRNNIIRRASRAAANVYLKDVKAQAYGAGRKMRTGLLGKSPGVAVSKKGDRITGRVKMRPINVAGKTKVAALVRKSRNLSVDPDKARRFAAFYWRFLEKGTPERKTKSGAGRGSVSARPWVNPIFNSDSTAALDAYKAAIQAGLNEEALKLPKTYRNRR